MAAKSSSTPTSSNNSEQSVSPIDQRKAESMAAAQPEANPPNSAPPPSPTQDKSTEVAKSPLDIPFEEGELELLEDEFDEIHHYCENYHISSTQKTYH